MCWLKEDRRTELHNVPVLEQAALAACSRTFSLQLRAYNWACLSVHRLTNMVDLDWQLFGDLRRDLINLCNSTDTKFSTKKRLAFSLLWKQEEKTFRKVLNSYLVLAPNPMTKVFPKSDFWAKRQIATIKFRNIPRDIPMKIKTKRTETQMIDNHLIQTLWTLSEYLNWPRRDSVWASGLRRTMY